ncbi:3-hydroxyacyl-CoA dehydrogenase family protein [Paenibacillus alvei]|uniref:3-hydroxyacyl-CoA dehydrogenase family protein n=1 Tax=Paenibacillus alvei TaxID=44250 RepID=A0ABT4GWQ1_PAEAL|nr:3-hydroxyacyl-CoA dehydrogenase family protein [Paenibacillus alvei]EJW15271.1 putative 3-hydroxybutyryl-CoA dehydrogenase Hbd [Paenibacillus alvei DSM 29]MCY9544168.1 3-hydroxyacyl-CoA dehydrogenase family protein [Paenibacillus alvei]MCY9702921.1 3-hydroxyacyl-CoA dehydrogenase family protein [Paenibacillus alvei]MCY9733236.1 3-hydroxyacyl-CoA dehydrogenase family protein [Paenibacillus alvei]MCY9754103.1 3-hydroxyacyl-CoA dehydrogenase family protein [Paenibacillus alvei]
MHKAGIIGAGTMGIGMTVDLIWHGIPSVLIDVSENALAAAKSEILKTVRLAPLINRSAPRLTADQALELVTFDTEISAVANCNFIVENATENECVKKEIYGTLDQICPTEVCFAANTSCISITRIGSFTGRPSKVIGMHFMNPVYMKSSVEVIRGYHTSADTIDQAHRFLDSLDKEAILVNDMPGFVSNRISHLFMNEAVYVVQDQVASPQEVDDIFKKCYGHKMGPLETADLIGLDTVLDSLNILYESYQDTKFRAAPLLQKMVDAGLYGKKAGKGFYNYS